MVRALLILLAIVACTAIPTDRVSRLAALDLDTERGANPWTHLELQNDPRNFTFAIVSDLTGGYREGVFPAAVERLNWLRPEFVMSVGDLIEGYTEDRAQLIREWDEFDGMLAPLKAPFFYVAGNHDYSNEVMAQIWRERLGRDYYHFVYHDVLFLVLNTEHVPIPPPREIEELLAKIYALRESDPEKAEALTGKLATGIEWDGDMEADFGEEQVTYFEEVIAAHPHPRWTFLFMHKPVWQGSGSDALRRIEAALGDRPFTAFAGHSHNYRRFEVDGRVHIRLGTTGGEWVVDDVMGNYDHILWLTMTDDGPSIANLPLDGILDESGRPAPDAHLWRHPGQAAHPAEPTELRTEKKTRQRR
jgi:predicted phosphodiesterase